MLDNMSDALAQQSSIGGTSSSAMPVQQLAALWPALLQAATSPYSAAATSSSLLHLLRVSAGLLLCNSGSASNHCEVVVNLYRFIAFAAGLPVRSHSRRQLRPAAVCSQSVVAAELQGTGMSSPAAAVARCPGGSPGSR